MRRVLIVNSTTPETSSGHLCAALGEAITSLSCARVESIHLNIGSGIMSKVLCTIWPSAQRRRALSRADVVIVHTSVLLVAWEILVGRITGKRLCAIYWDSYPESFSGLGRRRPGWLLKPYGWLERCLLRLCHAILPPSDDYLPHLENLGLVGRAIVVPPWPFTEIQNKRRCSTRSPVEIGFAGALNVIRGLDHALKTMEESTDCQIAFHTYGRDRLTVPNDVDTDRIKFYHHGFIPQSEIAKRLVQHDFGLIALHPDFPLPAFPSKCVSYICAGIPVIYIGPYMPHFEQFIVQSGVGMVIKRGEVLDLESKLELLNKNFLSSQMRAVEVLSLTKEKVSKIF